MNRELELRALAWEARRRGVRYGDVQGLPGDEVERIVGEFRRAMNIREDRTGREKRHFDAQRAMELYRAGASDREIGEQVERAEGTIRGWRHLEGLPLLVDKRKKARPG